MNKNGKPGDAPTSAPAMEINQDNHTTLGGAVSKELFIEKLEELLRMADLDISYLMPRYLRNGELDAIEVGYIGGGRRQVCVAMDSHAAIVRDVMREVS